MAVRPKPYKLVCPKCGYITKGTVCDTKKVVAKEIKHHEWWQFWKR